MLKLIKDGDRIILSYESETNGSLWIYYRITDKGSVKLRNTFTLTSGELISKEDEEDEFAPVLFEVARKKDQYYRFPKNILGLKDDLFIHKDIKKI